MEEMPPKKVNPGLEEELEEIRKLLFMSGELSKVAKKQGTTSWMK